MTIEIDRQLLERAKRALGESTTRGTIESALRLAVDQAESEFQARRDRQLRYLDSLEKWADLDVMASDKMWR